LRISLRLFEKLLDARQLAFIQLGEAYQPAPELSAANQASLLGTVQKSNDIHVIAGAARKRILCDRSCGE
jgi:hypothetical protein